MKRLQEIAGIWNWLPAFRAVAEMEKVTAAAAALCVSPSALSRSVRLLEDALGQELFHRNGRQLVLSDAGLELLDSVRDSMRRIHSAKQRIKGEDFFGHVWISGSPALLPLFVYPALAPVRRRYPDLVPSMRILPRNDVISALKQGVVDVAVVTGPVEEDGLAVHALATLRCHIYVSPAYERDVAFENGDGRAFAAVVSREGVPNDGWPCGIERNITMVGDCLQSVCDLCSQGEVLAFLPDVVARSKGFVPLEDSPSGEVALCVVHRPTLGPPGPAEMLANAILSLERSAVALAAK